MCFGGQLLAEVLGGAVVRAVRPEIGWRLLDTGDPGVVPAGALARLHGDAFTCPPGGRSVARTDVSLHAFVDGPHTGVQFHPEMTRGIVGGWISDAFLGGFDRSGRGPDAQATALVDAFLTRADALR